MSIAGSNLTELVHAWQRGDPVAESDLFVQVYDELRRRAARYLRFERANHTLQPTEIVHEAWMQLRGASGLRFANRGDFFAVSSTMMRHILVEHARRRNAEKRGGGNWNITLKEDMAIQDGDRGLDVLALNEALTEFERLDPARSKIVELKYFSGLTNEEVSEVLGRSVRSVNRDWFAAKAWLAEKLG